MAPILSFCSLCCFHLMSIVKQTHLALLISHVIGLAVFVSQYLSLVLSLCLCWVFNETMWVDLDLEPYILDFLLFDPGLFSYSEFWITLWIYFDCVFALLDCWTEFSCYLPFGLLGLCVLRFGSSELFVTLLMRNKYLTLIRFLLRTCHLSFFCTKPWHLLRHPIVPTI